MLTISLCNLPTQFYQIKWKSICFAAYTIDSMRYYQRHNIKHLLLRRSLCSIIFRRNKSPPIVPNSLTVATLGSRLGCCCNSPFPFVCAQPQYTSIQLDGFQQLVASFSRMQSSALLYIYFLIQNMKTSLSLIC